MGTLTLVLGGSRSGKSELAEKIAASTGLRVAYIATGAVTDDEMAYRVSRHRARRPQQWHTEEETRCLAQAVSRLGNLYAAVLIDDLTSWLTNLLLDEQWPLPDLTPERKEEAILAEVCGLLDAAEQVIAPVVIVAGEVGLGLVPPFPLGRQFRDVAGRANQLVAERSGNVYLVVAGLKLVLKEL